jgi:hypothetical protein
MSKLGPLEISAVQESYQCALGMSTDEDRNKDQTRVAGQLCGPPTAQELGLSSRVVLMRGGATIWHSLHWSVTKSGFPREKPWEKEGKRLVPGTSLCHYKASLSAFIMAWGQALCQLMAEEHLSSGSAETHSGLTLNDVVGGRPLGMLIVEQDTWLLPYLETGVMK